MFRQIHLLIGEAKESIHLQTYIFDDDTTGTSVANALCSAAARGVKVYVLVDGYASQGLSKPFMQHMQDAGVHFRFFQPLLKSSNFYFGRRLHHKVLVVDEDKAIVCGSNIADRYNDLPDNKAWLDMGLFIHGGPVARQLADICAQLYDKKEKIFFRTRKYDDVEAPQCNCRLRIRRNDWVMGKHQIFRTYRELFNSAEKEIIIMCSYFLPGIQLRSRLSAAVRRGVKVKVILAGYSDIRIVKWAERYLYRWMLRHDIDIYEYQPTVLHAKVGIADGQFLTVGSYNVNDLSTLASVELNIDVKGEEFVQPVLEEMENIIRKDCITITPKKINIYSPSHLLQLVSFYILRAALKVSTFYFRRQD